MQRRIGLLFLLLSFLLSACVTTGSRGRGDAGWQLLGEQEADFKRDRDRIEVGRRDGTFRELRVIVRGASLEMYDMLITFNDGRTFSPNIRAHFDPNTSSRDIDLPGDRRVIKSIEFTYRSPNRREGRAMVSVYGR